MAQRRQQRLDPIDLDNLEEMTSSGVYKLCEKRLDQVIQQQVAQLVEPHTEAETAMIRGVIKGLRIAQDIPKILRIEASRGEQQNGKVSRQFEEVPV